MSGPAVRSRDCSAKRSVACSPTVLSSCRRARLRLEGLQPSKAKQRSTERPVKGDTPPILSDKHYEAPSVFAPENILREARRQKRLAAASVPAVCVLDPDGDIVRYLKRTQRARREHTWACYHSELYLASEQEIDLGFVPCAVGASYAVL